MTDAEAEALAAVFFLRHPHEVSLWAKEPLLPEDGPWNTSNFYSEMLRLAGFDPTRENARKLDAALIAKFRV